MPTYNLKNNKTGKIENVLCSYNEMRDMVDSGEYEYIPGAPMIVSGTGTLVGKIDSGFNDVLTRIKKANRGSTIQTK